MASCIQFSPGCWGYSWCNKVSPCSFLTRPFFSRPSPIIYYSLLCKRFTSKHCCLWQPQQWLLAVTWREWPLTQAVPACSIPGKGDLSPAGTLTSWGRQCPQHHPQLGRAALQPMLLPAHPWDPCLCLHPCHCSPPLELGMSKDSIHLCCSLCSLVEQPDQPTGHQVSFHSPGPVFLPPYLCVCFCPSSLLWLHSSVTQITWGSCDIYSP